MRHFFPLAVVPSHAYIRPHAIAQTRQSRHDGDIRMAAKQSLAEGGGGEERERKMDCCNFIRTKNPLKKYSKNQKAHLSVCENHIFVRAAFFQSNIFRFHSSLSVRERVFCIHATPLHCSTGLPNGGVCVRVCNETNFGSLTLSAATCTSYCQSNRKNAHENNEIAEENTMPTSAIKRT